jgi:hypothetical protein
VELMLDHDVERPQQCRAIEAVGLEQRERLGNGLYGRNAVQRGLATNAIATGALRRERVTRQQSQLGILGE